MSVELYPHNQTAYENALQMLDAAGRAAVVHPTGTGKSFIAFKLAEEHPDARILWLSPSEYIFSSQKENYLRMGGDEKVLSDIIFLTYSKLMRVMDVYTVKVEDAGTCGIKTVEDAGTCGVKTGDGILTLPPDYVILDEFHRCGAEGWGTGVEMLLGTYPDAKVLGLSATHIRYLDNRRDMAAELFGGRTASKMELEEAVAEGILPAPLYICGIYDYGNEFERMSRRVENQRNSGVRDESAKLLDKLRHSLKNADGPREIFARHMKRGGKYIVFCSGRKHMEEMIGLAGEWFGDIDPGPEIYRAIYDRSESPEEVRRFREDKSSHLKLLFCIDMLNEGVHVADVDGAVLLRPTASPALYLQQVGRALSVPDKDSVEQPVIFDMVDNFDSLRCIDSFLEEYHRAVRKSKDSKKEMQYVFRLIDEARDSRRLFEQLCRCLASSWEACFAKAEEYYAEYGNLKVPKRYITEDGIALGSWLLTQRRVRAGAVSGRLTEEQIERLDSIGMVWESRIGKAWETGYRELLKFRKENGHVDIPARYVTEDGYPLGRFVTNQRQAWKNKRSAEGVNAAKSDRSAEGINAAKSDKSAEGVNAANAVTEKENTAAPPKGRILTDEQERRLNVLGFIWDKNEQSWELYYAAAKAFYEREGSLEIPVRYVTEDGLYLGSWIQRKSTEREELSPDKVKALEDIGMVWGCRYDAKWDEKYRLAAAYYKEHGNLEVPRDYEAGGVKLGRWVNALRSARKNPDKSHYRLDEERIRMLDRIGMRWAVESWETRYHMAELYYKEHGDLRISQAYVAEVDGERIWLGKWLAEQRKKHGNMDEKHPMTEEQARRLEAIGIEW